ncbi:hypothetical protein OIO90_000248 [Microbotryomycetes sp. JL221]|nr:hypothetical protein OIO90_000248 [Microbotryomycetes sp. JL221]
MSRSALVTTPANVFAPSSSLSATSYGQQHSRGQQNAAPPTRSVMDMLVSRPNASSMTASLEYEQLCKVVLERRLRNMFVLSLATSCLLLATATFDPTRLPASLFKVLPTLTHSPILFLAIVPIIILRKSTITTSPSTRLTRFSTIMALSDATNRKVWIAYLMSALLLSFSYTSCASYSSPNSNLGAWFFHKGRDTTMLNERFVFVTGLHWFVAAFATTEYVLTARSRLEFDSEISMPIPQRLTRAAVSKLPRVIRSTMLAYVFYVSLYTVARRPLLRLVVTSSLTSWTRPHLYSMLRHNSLFSITLIVRSLASSAFLFAVWDVTNCCFEVYATQALLVSSFSSRPNQALIVGLRSSDAYYQHFAFSELATLSLTNPQRRKAIFTDIKADVSKGAWADIATECLRVIGQELQRAKRKGQSERSSSSPQGTLSSSNRVNSSTSTQTGFNHHNATVKREDIFQPVKKTFFDKLASSTNDKIVPSNGTATSKAPGVSSAVSSSVSAVSSRVPSILQASQKEQGTTQDQQSTSASTTAQNDKAPVATVVRNVENLEQTLSSWVPRHWRGFLFSTNVKLVVASCVARNQMVVWAIESLANLLCASLQEDPYGVAQRDIPKILEGLTLYLDALEQLEKGLIADAEREAQGIERKQLMTRQVEEQVLPLRNAVREAIRQVVTDFEPYLSEFRFPTHVATRLQLLIDWG